MKILNPDGKVNLHTHTKYCDGTDSPEELVCEAVRRGFSALGFSGHEYSVFDGGFCMSREDTKRYRSEILDLKEKYRGQIDIYLGIERDYFGEGDDYPYDYVIGSLHYTKAPGGELLCVDESEEGMVRNVTNFFGGDFRAYVESYYALIGDVAEKTHADMIGHFDLITKFNGMVRNVTNFFGGDFRAYVESYYALIGDVAEKTHADMIGHFDLITKFNEGGKYFDENAKWYRKAALRALAQAAEKRPIFEINTGAVARGYRSRPYPCGFLLEEIERLGCPVILSSDCHEKNKLDFGFNMVLDKVILDKLE